MKVAFILGAGFSCEEQFPLVRGLKERVVHFLEAEQHVSYQTHLRPREDWPEFEKGLFYEGLSQVDPSGTLGFEELLIALRKAGGHGQTAITDQVLRIGAARLLWCISNFIWRVSAPYKNFAKRLAANAHSSAVVSFNWDLLIERALTEVGQKWSYTIANAATAVPVIKPHGSLNWNSFAQNPKLSAQYRGWHPIAPGSTLSFDRENPLANPDMQMTNSDLVYCIFPGDPDLPDSHPDLAKIWMEVDNVIAASEKVVFTGYSLPVYDEFARQKLATLCASKTVEVIDPSQSAIDSFRHAIPHATPIPKTFGQTDYAHNAG